MNMHASNLAAALQIAIDREEGNMRGRTAQVAGWTAVLEALKRGEAVTIVPHKEN